MEGRGCWGYAPPEVLDPVATRCAAALMALVTVPGCTRVTDRSRFEGPSEELEILATTPQPGETGVDPGIRIDLCMSGRIDPRSLDEVDATLSSGNAVMDSELSVQLVPWLEPGKDEPPLDTRGPWCDGSILSIQPQAELTPGAQFRLRMRPSAVGWAGESLSTEGPQWLTSEGADEPRYVLELTVDPTPSEEPPPLPGEGDPPPPAPTLRDLFEAGGPFDPARAQCSCHLDPDDPASELLDLSEPTRAYHDLLGSARLRDTGFPMVAPRDSSQSFLLHKLLREDDGDALFGVLGDPMPPEAPLPYADQLVIIQWIESGAAP